MKFLVTIAFLLPAVYASFPGSTFGVVYNTTSTQIPSTGHLATFSSSSSPDACTTISGTTPDLGAFFTISGVNAVLHNACNSDSIAALVPPNPPIDGLNYVLQWTTNGVADLPSGSIVEGFQLGPPPTFDTLTNVNAGPGSWKASQDNSGIFVVGWSDEDTAIPITLVKTGTVSIGC